MPILPDSEGMGWRPTRRPLDDDQIQAGLDSVKEFNEHYGDDSSPVRIFSSDNMLPVAKWALFGGIVAYGLFELWSRM